MKDPLHRRLVVDLIREMEATSRQDPSGVDLTKVFAKLRRELGIVE